MTVNFQFTLDDYRNAYRTHYRKGASAFTRWMMKISLVIGVLLLLASALIVITRQAPLNAAFSPLVLGAFWTWIGTGQIYSLSARSQFAKSPALRDPRRVEFNEDGVTTDAGIASSHVSWKAYLRYAERLKRHRFFFTPRRHVSSLSRKRVLQTRTGV